MIISILSDIYRYMGPKDRYCRYKVTYIIQAKRFKFNSKQ